MGKSQQHAVSGDQKIPYKIWVDAKNQLRYLLRHGGYSGTELSRLVLEDGDSPGWADNALRHRGLWNRARVKKVREEYERVRQEVLARESAKESQEDADPKPDFRAIAEEAREIEGVKSYHVDFMFDEAPSGVARRLREGIAPPEESRQRAFKYLLMLREGADPEHLGFPTSIRQYRDMRKEGIVPSPNGRREIKPDLPPSSLASGIETIWEELVRTADQISELAESEEVKTLPPLIREEVREAIQKKADDLMHYIEEHWQ